MSFDISPNVTRWFIGHISADFIMLYDISITYVRHLCQMILQYSHFVRKLLGNVDKKYVYRASRVRVRILRLPIYLGLYNLCIIRIAMSLKNKWMWSILNICSGYYFDLIVFCSKFSAKKMFSFFKIMQPAYWSNTVTY